jgi:cytochrome b involved in lipid metabolism
MADSTNTTTITTNSTTSNHQHPSPSTIAMATVWFALCAILVQKHTDLLAVFFAFLGSFGLLHMSKKPALVAAVATSASLTFLLVVPMPYLALSILTGHAAFSLWFAFLYGPVPSTWHLVQEAVSLTLGVVVLVVWRQVLTNYHTHVLMWTWYKAMEWTMSAVQQSGTNPPMPTIATPTPTKDGLNMPPHHQPPPHWCIHGVQYDLTDFTERHPGGEEAILLGQGRDCTALFESYHPFSTQHELVLHKYKTKDTTKKLERDLFYDIIKERVYRTLKEQGLDPDRDRTAPPLRLAYYCVVILCVVMAGVAHMQVRNFVWDSRNNNNPASPLRTFTHSLTHTFLHCTHTPPGFHPRILLLGVFWLVPRCTGPRCRTLCRVAHPQSQ